MQRAPLYLDPTFGIPVEANPFAGDFFDPSLTGAMMDEMFFGDGSDGNLTLTGTTAFSLKDGNYNNLTISGPGRLNIASFKLCVAGILDISAASTKAIYSTGGSLSGTAGTYGSTNTATTPTATGNHNGVAATTGVGLGTMGGQGGTGGQAATGGAATVSTPPAILYKQKRLLLEQFQLGSGIPGACAGSSGADGAGDGTNVGGQGGGSGFVAYPVVIYARSIYRGPGTAAGAISGQAYQSTAINANVTGATTGNTSGGGGGGGTGGNWVYVVYRYLLGSQAAQAVDVSGSAGGNGGPGKGSGLGGYGGGNGAGGRLTMLCLNSGIIFDQLHTNTHDSNPGSPNNGLTGGLGGAQVLSYFPL